MFTRTIINLAALTASTVAGDLIIQTPASLIECQPVLLNWSGGQGPYFLAAIPGGQPSAPAIKDFGQQTGNSLTWNVDIPAGTSVSLRVTDSTGVINYDQAVTIMPGSDTACMGVSSNVKPQANGAAQGTDSTDDEDEVSMSASSMSMTSSAAISISTTSGSMTMTMSGVSTSSSSASLKASGTMSGMSAVSSMSMSSASGSMSMSGSKSMSSSGSMSSASASRATAASAAQSSSGAGSTQEKITSGLFVIAAGVMGVAWF